MTAARPIDVITGNVTARRMDLRDLRVSHAVFGAGYRIPSHYHDRACLSVIVTGGFQQRFPGRIFDCPPGGVIAKPPGERHEDRWHDERTEHVIVEPDPDRHAELGPCRDVAETVRYARDAVAEGIARRIARELREPDGVTPLAVESLALQLLVRMSRLAGGEGTGTQPRWLGRVRDLVHDRYGDSLRLRDLAREVGVHPSHLSRTFSEHFGVGVAEYQRRVRLAAARRDLETTDLPLGTVAHRNGFADQSHLTRSLREATGLTPARYRAAYRR